MPASPWLRGLLLFFASTAAFAASLHVETATPRCDIPAAADPSPPDAASARIPASHVAQGTHDIAWTWLGSPTDRYSHDALGSSVHAGSLHAMVRGAGGSLHAVSVDLPPNRVIEDRVPRIVDLDGDGHDEIVVVESDLRLGASIAVYGVQAGAVPGRPALVERARSPFLGTSHRWLNPVGVADFDGDGHADIATVTTPHIDGVLTLYRYRPPVLEATAARDGVANHRIGTTEQQLAAILTTAGHRPTVIIPAMGLRDLHALRVNAGRWTELVQPVRLPAPAQRITTIAGGACVEMTDGRTVRATFDE